MCFFIKKIGGGGQTDKNLSVSNLKNALKNKIKKSLHTFVDKYAKNEMTQFNVMC
jgi:hypothetical protein